MTRRDKQQARLVGNIATNNRRPIRSNMPADGTVHGGRYTKVKALGKGSFGTVWLMRDLDGCSCVMKAISLKALPVAEVCTLPAPPASPASQLSD